MRKTLLLIASFWCYLGALACLLMAFGFFRNGLGFPGFLCIFAGVPVSISLGFVFDHVRNQVFPVKTTDSPTPPPDTHGTPWENNPGHIR